VILVGQLRRVAWMGPRLTLASSQAPGTLLPQHQISTSSFGPILVYRSWSTCITRGRNGAVVSISHPAH
jgi:hypothetical protein